MKSKRFLIKFICVSTIGLTSIMALNYFQDPGNIYYKRKSINKNSVEIFNKFTSSPFGIEWEGDERLLNKVILENTKKVYCIALGSSHVMQLSSVRSKKVEERCITLLNLGVSGASLEDIFSFISLIEVNNVSVSKLYIELSPWIFKWQMDKRFEILDQSFYHFIKNEKINYPFEQEGSISRLKNLINLDYTKLSYKKMKDEGFSFDFVNSISLVKDNPESSTLKKNVKLKDLSTQYHTKYERKILSENYNESPKYKLRGDKYHQKALEAFSKIINKISHKYNITFVLTPYHPSAFTKENSKYSEYLVEVEKLIRMKFSSFNILGSYKTNKCDIDEFYDYMHPKLSCLEKVLFD